MYSFVVADDERHVRKGIISLVQETDPEFILAAEAGSGSEAADLIRRHRPELAFVDVRMPGGSGLDAIRDTIHLCSETVFVIVSSYSQFEYARQAVQLGALDYLLKPVSTEEMRDLLQKVRTLIANRSDAGPELYEPEQGADLTNDTASVARRLMKEQYTLGVGVSQIAGQIGVTANYLSTCFHERYGEAPLSYLTKLRMEAAERLLRSGVRVQDVALRVGYRDVRHFSKKFTDAFGRPPSDYRSSKP